jgi:hypothetical protein
MFIVARAHMHVRAFAPRFSCFVAWHLVTPESNNTVGHFLSSFESIAQACPAHSDEYTILRATDAHESSMMGE